MEMKDLLKEWRIWVLVGTLMLATFMLFPMSASSPLPYEQTDDGDWTIATNINKGLDLEGGTRALLSPEGNVSRNETEEIAGILERRVSAFGLTQAEVRTVRLEDDYLIQMEIASTNQSQLRDLVSQEGRFEARMPITVAGEKQFTLDETYNFNYQGGEVTVDGRTFAPGDEFTLGNAKFFYVNNTESAANIHVAAYTGEEISSVLTSESLVQQSGGGYSFRFPVVLEDPAPERVYQIAQNYGVAGAGGNGYLVQEDSSNAKLMLYVDGQQQSALNVRSDFKTQEINQPSITGGAESAAQAREDMRELQAVLQSGRLPAPINIESLSTVSSSLGSQFMSAAILSIIGSLIAVGGLIFARYRNPKLVLPIVITGASEVYILLGAFFSTFITLNLASIAGIIAAVGTGVDDQIIITDESGKDKIRDWTKRLKRAFFVIFTSAASTIGAMMPIVSPSLSNMAIGAAGLGLIGYELYTRGNNPHYVAIGALAAAVSATAFQFNPSGFALQSVRGFAITTILGVMVGITITRPAYAKMLEYLEN